jgi:hypothetical protein
MDAQCAVPRPDFYVETIAQILFCYKFHSWLRKQYVRQ